jgi:RNase adaptor protein for sRNA GlmZ degradation
LAIRTKDLSKCPTNDQEWGSFVQFCNEVKEKIHKGTQDSIRKNLFVDLDRMELIHRYDKNKKEKPPLKKHVRAFISLSDDGLKIINEKKKNGKKVYDCKEF